MGNVPTLYLFNWTHSYNIKTVERKQSLYNTFTKIITFILDCRSSPCCRMYCIVKKATTTKLFVVVSNALPKHIPMDRSLFESGTMIASGRSGLLPWFAAWPPLWFLLLPSVGGWGKRRRLAPPIRPRAQTVGKRWQACALFVDLLRALVLACILNTHGIGTQLNFLFAFFASLSPFGEENISHDLVSLQSWILLPQFYPAVDFGQSLSPWSTPP